MSDYSTRRELMLSSTLPCQISVTFTETIFPRISLRIQAEWVQNECGGLLIIVSLRLAGIGPIYLLSLHGSGPKTEPVKALTSLSSHTSCRVGSNECRPLDEASTRITSSSAATIAVKLICDFCGGESMMQISNKSLTSLSQFLKARPARPK